MEETIDGKARTVNGCRGYHEGKRGKSLLPSLPPCQRRLSPLKWVRTVKTSQYFKFMKTRPDRAFIKEEWIVSTVQKPLKKEIQSDGRVRMWAKINEAGGKFLRVILLDDHKTVHNAFFDRTFKED